MNTICYSNSNDYKGNNRCNVINLKPRYPERSSVTHVDRIIITSGSNTSIKLLYRANKKIETNRNSNGKIYCISCSAISLNAAFRVTDPE